jgi:hypothetical protein
MVLVCDKNDDFLSSFGGPEKGFLAPQMVSFSLRDWAEEGRNE